MTKNKKKRWVFLLSLIILCILCFFVKKYILKKQKDISSCYLPLKIHGFSEGNVPYIEAEIEGKKVFLNIDLGFEGYASLSPSFINELSQKTSLNSNKTYGLTGKTYISRLYEIPKITLEKLDFFPMLIKEENPEFKLDARLGENKTRSPANFGSIGWRLFKNFILFLDLNNDICALANDYRALRKQGVSFEDFIEVPLILSRGLLEFEAQTEFGLLRCVLDTGCTLNMVNKDLETGSTEHMILNEHNTEHYPELNVGNQNLLVFDYKSSKEFSSFKIGEKEFGPFTFTQIKSPLDIDAFIGMEFFEDHIVILDFMYEKVYFSKSTYKEDLVSEKDLVNHKE